MGFNKLLSPIKIGRMQLENRVVMSPIHENLSQDGFVTPQMIDIYLRQAKGGLAMVIIGAIGVNPRKATLTRISDDIYIAGMKDLTKRIHSETGAKVCAQLMDIPKIARHYKQDIQEMTIEYISQVIDYFVSGAVRAREAGFDAIELHGAHGYTLASFLSLRNKREDEYGGSIEGRMKLVIDIYQKVRQALGPDYPVGIRINGDEFIVDGNTLQQSRVIARKLAEKGLDYISVSAGGKYEDSKGELPKYEIPANYPPHSGYSGYRSMPPAWMPEAVNVYLAADIRKTIRAVGHSIPVITAGRIPRPELAERILEEGQADIIALARPVLRDPDWMRKVKEGREKEINQCTYCNYCLERVLYDEPGLCRYVNPSNHEAEENIAKNLKS